jgi:hypothetical protein
MLLEKLKVHLISSLVLGKVTEGPSEQAAELKIGSSPYQERLWSGFSKLDIGVNWVRSTVPTFHGVGMSMID